jgi:hypothetical protein
MRFIFGLIRKIIVINILLLLGAKLAQRFLPDDRDTRGDEFDVTTVMEESIFGSTATALRRAGVTTLYGAAEVDLRDAELSPTGAGVNAFTFMGQTTIRIPKGWTVLSEQTVIGGSLERTGGDVPDHPVGTIHLTGATLFGATVIAREA